ncbi:MAG: crossover junction endodeoxyribonuclease RuvC [Candidatus Paceibacterota bacterium]|jgi:crossover junction endodeoxyribonuclease RuvC
MRILGIDPGYERLGIAIVEKNTSGKEIVVFSECFKTNPKLSFEERVFLIGERVVEIIEKFKPKVLSIETLFLTSNHKTVMRVSETRGVIIYEAKKAGLKIFEVSPPEIKTAVAGYGKADKKQVMKMVKLLVKIENSKTSDDELDAIAIALTALAVLHF